MATTAGLETTAATAGTANSMHAGRAKFNDFNILFFLFLGCYSWEWNLSYVYLGLTPHQHMRDGRLCRARRPSEWTTRPSYSLCPYARTGNSSQQKKSQMPGLI